MPASNDMLERCRAQADDMIAVAAKTRLPTIYADLSKAMADAHGFLVAARRNALRDVSD